MELIKLGLLMSTQSKQVQLLSSYVEMYNRIGPNLQARLTQWCTVQLNPNYNTVASFGHIMAVNDEVFI